MSYILDALRRSQAERERGQLPHLHAQPATLGVAPAAMPARSWLWPGLAVLALLLLGALVLLLLRRPEPAAPAAAQPAAITPPAPVATPAVVAAPAAAAAPAPLPVVVSAPPAAPANNAPIVVNARPEVPTKLPAKPAPPAALPPSAQPPTPPPAKAEPQTLTLAQLSPEQRRELPPLVVGGSVWSDNAASRFVILNGQLLHEGESVAPGTVVERIGPKTAWVRWRELRLELPL
jgi:general secretion pathway protein B